MRLKLGTSSLVVKKILSKIQASNKLLLSHLIINMVFIQCYKEKRSMSSLEKPQTQYQQGCQRLLAEPEIRFAGVINLLGNLVAGGMKKGLTSLEDQADKRKMYMELVLRVTTRKEFDYSLGPVKYSASRRKQVVVMSFPLDNAVLLVSAQPDVNIDETAKKVMKIWNN